MIFLGKQVERIQRNRDELLLWKQFKEPYSLMFYGSDTSPLYFNAINYDPWYLIIGNNSTPGFIS